MGDGGGLEGATEVYGEFMSQLDRVRQFINDFLKMRVPSGAVPVS
jgi:hypothetical protein